MPVTPVTAQPGAGMTRPSSSKVASATQVGGLAGRQGRRELEVAHLALQSFGQEITAQAGAGDGPEHRPEVLQPDVVGRGTERAAGRRLAASSEPSPVLAGEVLAPRSTTNRPSVASQPPASRLPAGLQFETLIIVVGSGDALPGRRAQIQVHG